MKKRIFALVLCLILMLTGCSNNNNVGKGETPFESSPAQSSPSPSEPEAPKDPTDLGDDHKTFGESLGNK